MPFSVCEAGSFPASVFASSPVSLQYPGLGACLRLFITTNGEKLIQIGQWNKEFIMPHST